MSATMVWATVGIALGLAGLVVVVRLRFGANPREVRLAGVGPLSRVSHVVIGLALLGAGYHVFVHAVGVMAHFRAPLGIAIGVAIVAILGTIGADAIENRVESRPRDE